MQRRGFLARLLALAAAPSILGGFSPTAIARTVSPNRYVSVLDFGAERYGNIDSTRALNAAINSVGALGGKIYFPQGTYKLS